MKRIHILLLFIFVFGLSGMLQNSANICAASVPIDNAIFPDKDFRHYISTQIDKDKNNILSEDELAHTQKIAVDANDDLGLRIHNFQGIEKFTELQELSILQVVNPKEEDECGWSVDISLDVSQNTKLRTITCQAGKIEALNLSSLLSLEEIVLSYEYPTQDLSKLTRLKRVVVQKNVILPDRMPELTELSIYGNVVLPSEMPKLEKLTLDSFEHFPVHFQSWPTLSELSLKWIIQPELDLNLSGLVNLKSFSCLGSKISTINLSGCAALERLDVSGMIYTDNAKLLILNGCVNIRELLFCYNWELSGIRFQDLTNLEYLSCQSSGLQELDLQNNHKLKTVFANVNKLTSIKLSTRAKYDELNLCDNQLTKLDLRNINVKRLSCEGNKLKQIQLSTKSRYKEIQLSDNCLTKLDLRNVKADTVICRRNDLKKLFLSPGGRYKKIDVNSNFLTKLNLQNINVRIVSCNNNMIRSLKVRKNKFIQELNCQHNRLKSLDIRQCKKLVTLRWYSGSQGLKRSKILRSKQRTSK